MLKLILKGVFLWRRNHLPSIIFKMSVFAALGWFVVNMFFSSQSALIAAGVASVIALLKYSLQARRESAALLKAAGGDKQKFAALKKMTKQKGMGGALMSEMLRAELDDDYDDEDEVEMTAEQRQANVAESQANLERVLAVIDAHPEVVIENRDERIAELRENFASGDYLYEINEALRELLPERALSICYEGYCNDGDHAGLVEEIAEASAGKWTPTNIESSIDEETEKCTVSFMDDGKKELWRFSQESDWVNQNFFNKLLTHARSKGDFEIVTLDCEDFFEAMVLPTGFYAALKNDTEQAAA